MLWFSNRISITYSCVSVCVFTIHCSHMFIRSSTLNGFRFGSQTHTHTHTTCAEILPKRKSLFVTLKNWDQFFLSLFDEIHLLLFFFVYKRFFQIETKSYKMVADRTKESTNRIIVILLLFHLNPSSPLCFCFISNDFRLTIYH